MASASPFASPKKRSVADIKSGLLQPALTSHYEILIGLPPGDFSNYLSQNGITWGISQDSIQLACSDAVLPGSNFATTDLNGDFTGVTERHAYRRVYDDRIDLSFYVQVSDKDSYASIRFFEIWMKFITNESIAGDNSVVSPYFYYSVKYPSQYYGNLSITKFERQNYTNRLLSYNFINVYPISIASMPISFDTANLLKVTVSFSYIRYYIQGMNGQSSTTPLTPAQQAAANNLQFNPSAFKTDQLVATPTVGGVPFPTSLASGNTGRGLTQFDVTNTAFSGASLLKTVN
jgi:hypothetical protein